MFCIPSFPYQSQQVIGSTKSSFCWSLPHQDNFLDKIRPGSGRSQINLNDLSYLKLVKLIYSVGEIDSTGSNGYFFMNYFNCSDASKCQFVMRRLPAMRHLIMYGVVGSRRRGIRSSWRRRGSSNTFSDSFLILYISCNRGSDQMADIFHG